MEEILIEFSGWIKLSPEKINFVNIGSKEEKTINGTEWIKLSEEERSDYVVEDLIDAQRDAEDGCYDTIDVCIIKTDDDEIDNI